MRDRLRIVLLVVAFCAAMTACNRPARGEGYRAPRTPDGKPDFQGIWEVLNTANVNLLDHAASPDGPAGQSVVEGNEIPYQASALEKKKENFANRLTADPERKCFLPGVPRATYIPLPFQIVQTPGLVAILYEYVHTQRRIYTDGSKHQEDVDFWLGDSRGRWEGDTLVVEVTNHKDVTWFDRAGDFHSDALKVIERYTRVGEDRIDYEAMIEDPKVFTRPWKIRMPLYRRVEPGAQILDNQCYAFEENTRGLTVPLFRESPLK